MVTRGFFGRRPSAEFAGRLPPGQYVERGFPVLSFGPTPRIDLAEWRFTLKDGPKPVKSWNWQEFNELPRTRLQRDIHCVTKWSKLGTGWKGVSLDTLLEDVESAADYAMAHSYGGYTTNVPVEDLLDGKAWIAYEYDGEPLHPEHGGPARLLIPHLYFWKSAKWVNGLRMMPEDEPGFWEAAGYHMYGDPWSEQRYHGD